MQVCSLTFSTVFRTVQSKAQKHKDLSKHSTGQSFSPLLHFCLLNWPIFFCCFIFKNSGSCLNSTRIMKRLLTASHFTAGSGTSSLTPRTHLKPTNERQEWKKSPAHRLGCFRSGGFNIPYQFVSSFHLHLHIFNSKTKQVVKLRCVAAANTGGVNLRTHKAPNK